MDRPPSEAPSLSPSRRQSALTENEGDGGTQGGREQLQQRELTEGRHALQVEQPLAPASIPAARTPVLSGGAGVLLPQPVAAEDFSRLISMNMATMNRASLAAAAAAASRTGAAGTGGGAFLGGIASLPVAAFSQQTDVSLIPTEAQIKAAAAEQAEAEAAGIGGPAAPSPEAVGLPVEGGPEAAVPATPFPPSTAGSPSPSPAAAAPTPASAPVPVPVPGERGPTEVTKLPASVPAVTGEGAGQQPSEGLWLGATRPLKNCWRWCTRKTKRGKKKEAAEAAGRPKGAEMAAVAKGYDADDHRLTLQELAERYKTGIDFAAPAKSVGLTSDEAARRLKEDGPNMLSPPKTDPEWLKFLKQFTNLLMMMLIFASALAFISYGITSDWTVLVLAVVLLVVVFLTCVLNWWTERSASNVLASIRSMLPAACVVVRGGQEVKIPAEQLVTGDIVHLTIGNRIPADMRLITVGDLKVEQSSLTGESEPVECSVQKQSELVTEAKNFVFNSSLVMEGDARGVVCRTGDHSFIGSIAGLAGQSRNVKSSLEIEIEHVVRFIAVVGIVLGIIAMVLGLANGRGVVFSLTTGLLLTIVANVPEGLPTTVVTVLNLTAQRMGESHILIKKADLVETLGATSCICSDKTGTITMNKMTVENIWCNRSFSAASKVRHGAADGGGISGAGLGPGPTALTIGRGTSMAPLGAGVGGGGGGGGETIGRGASFAQFPLSQLLTMQGGRRPDPVASMTIGRQMSQLNGTMVIHSAVPGAGGGGGGMGGGGGATIGRGGYRPAASFAVRPGTPGTTGLGPGPGLGPVTGAPGVSGAAGVVQLPPHPHQHPHGGPPIVASPAPSPVAAAAGQRRGSGGSGPHHAAPLWPHRPMPDFSRLYAAGGGAAGPSTGIDSARSSIVSQETTDLSGFVSPTERIPSPPATTGAAEGPPRIDAGFHQQRHLSTVVEGGAAEELSTPVPLPSSRQPMPSQPLPTTIPIPPETTLGHRRLEQVVPHESERALTGGDLAAAGVGTRADPALYPHEHIHEVTMGGTQRSLSLSTVLTEGGATTSGSSSSSPHTEGAAQGPAALEEPSPATLLEAEAQRTGLSSAATITTIVPPARGSGARGSGLVGPSTNERPSHAIVRTVSAGSAPAIPAAGPEPSLETRERLPPAAPVSLDDALRELGHERQASAPAEMEAPPGALPAIDTLPPPSSSVIVAGPVGGTHIRDATHHRLVSQGGPEFDPGIPPTLTPTGQHLEVQSPTPAQAAGSFEALKGLTPEEQRSLAQEAKERARSLSSGGGPGVGAPEAMAGDVAVATGRAVCDDGIHCGTPPSEAPLPSDPISPAAAAIVPAASPSTRTTRTTGSGTGTGGALTKAGQAIVEKRTGAGTAQLLAKGGEGGAGDEEGESGGTIKAQGSWRSFNSFQGMTNASWRLSNPFTRLVTVAAICNRAQFSTDTGTDAAKIPGAKKEKSQEDEAGAFTSRLKKQREEAEAKSKAAGPGRFTGTLAGPLPMTGETRKILGDASEAALLTYVDSLIPIHEFRLAYPALYEVPFNSVTKVALAIAADPENHSSHIIFMKGAPERILDRCSHFLYNGMERPVDSDFRLDFQQSYERFAFAGERVLAFAYKEFTAPREAAASGGANAAAVYKKTLGKDEKTKEDKTQYPTQGLVFAGLISLMDPPKPGTAEAVAICRDAFIKCVIVTGDHPLTAESIARKVNVVTLPTAREVAAEDGVEESEIPLSDPRVGAAIIPGHVIGSLTPEQWDTLLAKEEVVFARTSPQQKLEIVSHFQRLGHIVAVTGDGTNDSPALKRAQVGISMGGPTASDVAREAADVILLNDDFSSITLAVEMGRLCYANIKKSIAYTLSHATPEVVPIFLDLAFGIPLALPGLMILVVDMITEQGPAIALSYEPAESALMRQPPRDVKRDRMVDRRLLQYSYLISGLVTTGVCLLAYFIVFLINGISGSDLWQLSTNGYFQGNDDSVGPFTNNAGRTYSVEEQTNILYQAHSAFFLNLVFCQAINHFLCKTRVVSLRKHGILRNTTSAYGVSLAIFVALAIVFITSWSNVFQSFPVSGWYFLTPLIYLLIMYPYTEWTKSQVRKNPNGWVARNLQW